LPLFCCDQSHCLPFSSEASTCPGGGSNDGRDSTHHNYQHSDKRVVEMDTLASPSVDQIIARSTMNIWSFEP
jgi:hypothetical protein